MCCRSCSAFVFMLFSVHSPPVQQMFFDFSLHFTYPVISIMSFPSPVCPCQSPPPPPPLLIPRPVSTHIYVFFLCLLGGSLFLSCPSVLLVPLSFVSACSRNRDFALLQSFHLFCFPSQHLDLAPLCSCCPTSTDWDSVCVRTVLRCGGKVGSAGFIRVYH